MYPDPPLIILNGLSESIICMSAWVFPACFTNFKSLLAVKVMPPIEVSVIIPNNEIRSLAVKGVLLLKVTFFIRPLLSPE